ncbi:transposable element Tcb2 transposase [Trichonephila clavipes]|nr:transposable element Tcb2 transposase [Trichonephila clavipes]
MEEDMDVCKCILPSRHGGTINSCRAASPLVWWWKGERGESPLTTPRCPPSKLGWKRAKLYCTCMVLKATDNDRCHLALCHDEFHGPRSGLCRSAASAPINHPLTGTATSSISSPPPFPYRRTWWCGESASFVPESGELLVVFSVSSGRGRREARAPEDLLPRTVVRITRLQIRRHIRVQLPAFSLLHSTPARFHRQPPRSRTQWNSSGRPRGTTPADDRYIVLQARRNRRQTAGEIARHTTQATGRPISRFTVARRLHGGGLFARRPVRCVPLTLAHRRRRSLWCREHRNWRDNEWGRVLFTDESRFSLSSDSHRILIWRERGSGNHPSNTIERDRYGGRGVLVWGGIMLGSHTDLHIFDAGSVNGTRYCNEILLPYVRLFRGAMGLQFLFMNDNAPCHRTVAAEQLLESEDIERMDWPARSPDLNPIQHVWDFLGRRLAARTLPPVTIRELRLALQDEWAAMPQQLIDTLILSMGRRCETSLAVRGDHIPY